MKKRLGWRFGLFAIVAAGCGGDSGASFACTEGTETTKTCVEYYASTATSASFAQFKTFCIDGGGVASDTCARVGADGGCRMTDSQNGVSVSTTSWTYSGDAAGEMQSCSSSGGSWVAP